MSSLSLHHHAFRDLLADARESVRTQSAPALRRLWYENRWLWWQAYWDLQVEGVENVPADGPMLLCANHTSHLDAPAILAALPVELALRVTTAAARDIFGQRPLWRAAGEVMANTLPLGRGAEFASGLRSLERVLAEGRPLILFPEGRRSPDGTLLPFKHGAAMLAIRTGAPIVPIHLSGLYESLPRERHLPRPATAQVCFGRPIDPIPLERDIDEGTLSKHEAYATLTASLKDSISRLA